MHICTKVYKTKFIIFAHPKPIFNFFKSLKTMYPYLHLSKFVTIKRPCRAMFCGRLHPSIGYYCQPEHCLGQYTVCSHCILLAYTAGVSKPMYAFTCSRLKCNQYLIPVFDLPALWCGCNELVIISTTNTT